MARLPPPSRIKTHRVYSVWEAADALGRHRQTVIRWIRSGALAADRRQKPWLIRGADLKAFLGNRSQVNKCKLALHHVYCLGCKSPQEPAGKFAEYSQLSTAIGQLSAICPTCERMMHKFVRRADVEAIRARIEVSVKQAVPRLVSRSDPRLHVTSGEESADHAKAQFG